VLRRGILQGASLLAALLAVFGIARASGIGDDAARTLAFIGLVVGNLGTILSNQSWTERAWRTAFWRNRMALVVTTGAISTLALIVTVPSLRDLFRFAPPPIAWLVASPIVALASVWWVDLLGGMADTLASDDSGASEPAGRRSAGT
jgi:Ca2+-transporting ATPase